jgi:hypothetical protein
MKALQAYIEQKNRWNAIFKGEQFEIQTAAGRQRIANALDADLSPENLTCDGELPRAEVARRYKALRDAAVQLTALDPQVKMYEFYTGE